MKGCAWDGCDREYHARGYCQRHYVRLRRHGELPPIRFVAVVAGAGAGKVCAICHTPLMEHELTKACYLEVQYA